MVNKTFKPGSWTCSISNHPPSADCEQVKGGKMQNRYWIVFVFLLIFPCFLVTSSCTTKNVEENTYSSDEVKEENLPSSDSTEEDNLTDASADSELDQSSEIEFQQDSELLVSKDIYFKRGSYSILEDAHEILKEKGEFLLKYPAIKVIIEGHSDEPGTDEFNMILGEKRAGSVKSFLLGYGINSSRLAAVSYGKERPAVSGRDKKNRKLNRRVHFEIENN